MCKPIVKWVGGKRQLLDDLMRFMPTNYNRYFEPFIGGGALFFALKPKNGVINDYNTELTNLYCVVRDRVNELIEDLKKHQNTEEYYYKIRELDRDKESYEQLSDVEKASRFIYLNKTGFNGLYRVNKKGQCNVPFGRYKNPKWLDEDNLRACSQVLKDTEILNGDFEIIKPLIKKEDFIYLDPPYVPLNTTSSFTAYTDKGFDDDMQFRLKEFCDYINSIGAYFMLSNSYTDFILNLYKDYNIKIVMANRAINCKGDGRDKIKEVVVVNY
ncbi:DNA adenine methylase [Hydrogenimonas thermophila]|uniref:Site-specific DNA-methyltransferase (adenine-specific) n=1 Tax=Hydrogenimonas thermophila TaxID=223786 RepID=A0A1I5MU50_9BACT|nr:DNA adenine methylase [Hydrogenimonas thermophila]WOE68928.1 DNA adenine methylase [Hydrogenimonas thermophila]WOE71435.1 DNA adenine methylase [Hydrogenimonas thermophila]SFP13055.1 DNA adenine methylase [Hydrogenimonas thermophila]